MNRFGLTAQRLWQTLAPTALAQIPDPSRHFSTLGQQAEQAWVELADQMQGPDVPGETYLEKVGRINAVRRAAEEIIQAEWLMPPAELVEPDPDEVRLETSQQLARWQELVLDVAMTIDFDPQGMRELGITAAACGLTEEVLEQRRVSWLARVAELDARHPQLPAADDQSWQEKLDEDPDSWETLNDPENWTLVAASTPRPWDALSDTTRWTLPDDLV